MSNFRKRSLNQYGLAMLVIAGSGLVAATSRSGADVNTPLQDYDCWTFGFRICNQQYFPPCFEKPEGTTCFKCPYTVYASAHCVGRVGYVCQASSDVPYDCGPRLYGMCLVGSCFGEVVSEDRCTMIQCGSVTP